MRRELPRALAQRAAVGERGAQLAQRLVRARRLADDARARVDERVAVADDARGDPTLALVIAPNALLHPGAHAGPALTGMTSIRGRCHTFDARADGYLRGEGCGAVVLDSTRP